MGYYISYYKDTAEKIVMMWVNAYASTSMHSVNKDAWITYCAPSTGYRLLYSSENYINGSHPHKV